MPSLSATMNPTTDRTEITLEGQTAAPVEAAFTSLTRGDTLPTMSKKRPGRRLRRGIYLLIMVMGALLCTRWIVLPWVLENELKKQIANRFKGRISHEGLELDLLASQITVRDFTYYDPGDKPVLRLKSGVARYSLNGLFGGKRLLNRLDFEDAELFLSLTPDGSNVEENFKAVKKPVKAARAPDIPHLVFHNCMVHLKAPQIFQKDLQVRVEGEIHPSGLDPQNGQVKIALHVHHVNKTGEDCTLNPIHFQGDYNFRTTTFKLSTDSRGVDLDPEIRRLLSPLLVDKGWDWLNPVGSVRIEVEGDFHRVEGLPRYHVSLFNARGLGIRIKDFPYALADLQGVTLIKPGESRRRGHLELVNLRGTHGRAIATISGEVFGYLEESGEPWVHLSLEGRDIPLDEDLKNALEKVEPELGQIWEAISPAGSADFQCLLYKTNKDNRVRAALTANIRNGIFNYLGFISKPSGTRQGFPYPLTQVSGSFETHLGNTRFDFVGRGAGRSDIRVVGEVRSARNSVNAPVLDINIRGKDVPLDDTLRRAMLDFNGDDLWKQIQPDGHADILVHLTQASAQAPLMVDVTLNLKGRAAFIYKFVPIKLTGVWGKVHFKSGWKFPRFVDVFGTINTGNFRLKGTLKPLDTDTFTITLNGPFLNKQLTHALRRSPVAVLREVSHHLIEYEPEGEAEAIVTLSGLGDLRTRVAFRFKGANANGPSLPFELENLNGVITYDHNSLTFKKIIGWYQGGKIEMNGEMQLGDKDGWEKLEFNGKNIPLDRARIPASGPLKWLGPHLTRWKPRGAVKTLEFEHNSRDTRRCPSLAMTFDTVKLFPTHTLIDRTPLGKTRRSAGSRGAAHDRNAFLPIEIEKGSIFYNPTDGLRLMNIDASIGKAELSGMNVRYKDHGMERIVTLSTRAEGVALDNSLFSYLGGGIPEVLKSKQASGTFDAAPLNLEVRIPTEGSPTIRFTRPFTTLKFNSLTIKLGPLIQHLTGTILVDTGSSIQGAETHVSGRMDDLDLTLFNMQINDLKGRFDLAPEKNDGGKGLFLKLDKMAASLYEGRMGPRCMLDISLSSQHAFEGFFQVNNVQVKQLIEDLTASGSSGDIVGLLSGQFRFLSDSSDLSNLVGTGRGTVKEGKFGSIPAFVTMFNIFQNHFHEISTNHFEVKDRTVYLGSRGHLEPDNPLLWRSGRTKEPYFKIVGNALKLEGSGSVNFGGEMDFQFSPGDFWLTTPIPGIRDFLELIYQQAGTIYVLGTIERINVQPILFGLGRPVPGEKQPLRIPDRGLLPAKRW